MDLYLVRHGESNIPVDAVQSDYPLSDLGRQQALRVAERFRGMTIDHLISTPYKRTLETARAIAEATGTELIEEPGLGAIDAGGLSITPYSQRKERWPEYFANPSPLQDYRAFGGEGPAEFYERVTAAFVERIWDRHWREPVRVVCVCHAETVNAVLLHLLSVPFEGWQTFSIDHTAVSFVDVRHGRPRIRYVNDSSHLGELSRGHRGTHGGEPPHVDRHA